MALDALLGDNETGRSWGNVDIAMSRHGNRIAIEINPMSTIFLPAEHELEDITIGESSPGGIAHLSMC